MDKDKLLAELQGYLGKYWDLIEYYAVLDDEDLDGNYVRDVASKESQELDDKIVDLFKSILERKN